MRIGIFGMGAVGLALYKELYGYNELYILADENRIARYNTQALIINDKEYKPNYSSDIKVDLVFVCVKNYQLEASLKDLEAFVDDNTIILPLLNGITAHDIIQNHFKNNNVLYGVINVEANKKNNVLKTSKIINLQFGEEYNEPIKDYLLEIDEILSKYNVNHKIYPDMKKRVWLKWMLNMGINQISALCKATYKDMSHPLLKELMSDIFNEVYHVSQAYNIGLDEDDLLETNKRCEAFTSDRVTSLTLDFYNSEYNELDSFSLTLIKLAEAKNIDVPVNKVLYKLLKSLDDNLKSKR